MISETADYEVVFTLLSILRGIDLPNVRYSIKANYLVLLVLKHQIICSHEVRRLVMAATPSLKAVVAMVEPINLDKITPKLEECVYHFLLKLVDEDMDTKRVIGRLTLESVFLARLRSINSISDEDQILLYDEHNHNIENHFFTLLKILAFNCLENSQLLKDKSIVKELEIY